MSLWGDGTPISSVSDELRSRMGDRFEEKEWAEEYLFDLFLWLIKEPHNLDLVRSNLDKSVAELIKKIGQSLAYDFDFITETIDGIVAVSAEEVKHNNPYYGKLLALFVATQVSA